MTERYPPTGVPADPYAQGRGAYETSSMAVERQPWSPAQIVALVLGIVFVVLGGIALARTGINSHVTSDHVSVVGSIQTQLMGYLELAYGALLLAVGSIPGAGRAGMSFLGILALVFGIIVVAQPSSFFHTLGIGSGYGVFLIIAGAVLAITSMVSPIYWGFSRRSGYTRNSHMTARGGRLA